MVFQIYASQLILERVFKVAFAIPQTTATSLNNASEQGSNTPFVEDTIPIEFSTLWV